MNAMDTLKPASLLSKLTSALFPKRLQVELRTETLKDGTVEVHPVYTIDGKLVPSEQVSSTETQTILGYRVEVGKDSLLVQKETGGQKRRISKKSAATLLGMMSQQGVRVRSRGKQTTPSVTTVRPELKLELSPDDSLKVSAQLVTPNGIVVEKPLSLEDLRKEDGWFVSGDDLYKVDQISGPLNDVVLGKDESTTLTGEDVPRLLQQVEINEKSFSFIEKSENLKDLSVYGDKPRNKAKVSGDKNSIKIEPSIEFLGKNGITHTPDQSMLDKALQQGGGFARIPDGWIELESQAIIDHQKASEELHAQLGDLDDIRGQNIPRTLTTLMYPGNLTSHWNVYFSEEVKNSHRIVDTPSDTHFALNVVESDGKALLELDPRYNHERFRLSHLDLTTSVSAKEEWVRRDNAWIKIDQSRFEQVSKAIRRLGLQATEKGILFPASRREEIVNVFSRLGSIEHSESYSQFLLQLADFERIEDVPIPDSLRSNIQFRPYQKHGYNWLAFLRRFGLNGILADDMGLGKTLQTLAVIRRGQEQSDGNLPSLIICPTSLVVNWKQEASKFFDGFNISVYTGKKRRQLLQDIYLLTSRGQVVSSKRRIKNQLLITSFGVALRDYEVLSRIPWMYVVVDEAHQIKNPSAKRTHAIKTINGENKLALTGTPIQNNLDELWSLFDFVMPGYLGSRSKFRDNYGNGSQVNWQAVHHDKTGLKRRIYPFVMRRLKEHVADDLPEKVIITLPVDLTPAQVSLYKHVIESAEFKQLQNAVEEKGAKRAQVEMLAVYTRLRMICNHPSLDSSFKGRHKRAKDSGKLTALRELMLEISEGEHRTLVFCQSTQMLDIISEYFEEWGFKHLRLDGSTAISRRQELVDEFNSNHSNLAFLISTKAGGTGLNLTGADTVIFYDHDWNPANDRQAQDRAYRIGQKRNVTVYKLVSAGTIEERIIERQEVKQSLADQIVGVDQDGYKEIDKQQLMSLFELNGYPSDNSESHSADDDTDE